MGTTFGKKRQEAAEKAWLKALSNPDYEPDLALLREQANATISGKTAKSKKGKSYTAVEVKNARAALRALEMKQGKTPAAITYTDKGFGIIKNAVKDDVEATVETPMAMSSHGGKSTAGKNGELPSVPGGYVAPTIAPNKKRGGVSGLEPITTVDQYANLLARQVAEQQTAKGGGPNRYSQDNVPTSLTPGQQLAQKVVQNNTDIRKGGPPLDTSGGASALKTAAKWLAKPNEPGLTLPPAYGAPKPTPSKVKPTVKPTKSQPKPGITKKNKLTKRNKNVGGGR